VGYLRAPVAISVEVRIVGDADRRVFRLASAVGEDGIRLERPAPFELGRPVDVRFVLPDAAEVLSLRAEVAPADEDGEGEHGGRELTFVAAPSESRQAIHRYVGARLGLPALLG
jgi:hypothetical protein